MESSESEWEYHAHRPILTLTQALMYPESSANDMIPALPNRTSAALRGVCVSIALMGPTSLTRLLHSLICDTDGHFLTNPFSDTCLYTEHALK